VSGDHAARSELCTIGKDYVRRVDVDEPDDVRASGEMLMTKVRRVPDGPRLARFIEDTYIHKKKKLTGKFSGKGGTGCRWCGARHADNACWDKFPHLRPQRYGGNAPNAPGPGAG
jgi:hypothetical protein